MGETDLSAVIDRLDELEAQNRRLREENEQLRERVDDLEDDVDEHDDRLDDVERETQILESRADALTSIQDRLEERVESGDLADDADAGAAPDVPRETPLENVVALPEDVAEQSLSKQDKRARFIAMDPRDYGDKCFDGRIITAGRIGRTLAAGLDVDPHPEKVRRVMKRLNELGKDSTKLRKKNGEKRINIDEAAVDRLERHAEMDHADHDVVSRGEA